MPYFFPYILLLVFLGLSAFLHEHSDDARRREITIVSVSVLFVFFAFRGYVYTDWVAYVEFFKNVQWTDVFAWEVELVKDGSYEPGYTLLNLVCRSIADDYSLLVFVCTTIDLMLLLRFLRHRGVENIPLALLFFVAFSGLGLMFNLMRNSISILIFLNALEYIEQRRLSRYLAMCFAALMFHWTSVVFFPLYFVLRVRLNRWLFAGLSLFVVAFYFSGISILPPILQMMGLDEMMASRVEAYTETMSSSRAFSISGTLETLVLIGFVTFYYKDIVKRHNDSHVVVNALLLYFVMYYMLAEFYTVSARFSILFVFSYWLIWPDLISLQTIQNNRRAFAGVLFCYICYMTMSQAATPCHEYDNILFGAKSYEQRLAIFHTTYESDE